MYAHTEQLTTLFMSQFYAASFPPPTQWAIEFVSQE